MGAPSDILSQQSSYSVPSSTLSHSGTYICRANNSRGSVEDDVSVSVRMYTPTTEPATTESATTTSKPTTRVSGKGLQ